MRWCGPPRGVAALPGTLEGHTEAPWHGVGPHGGELLGDPADARWAARGVEDARYFAGFGGWEPFLYDSGHFHRHRCCEISAIGVLQDRVAVSCKDRLMP